MCIRDSPNIIFILTDDQGAWALGAAGNQEILTPNLDQLAHDGAYFPNFFCASPVCSPARASILTGLTPSQHGIHDWIRSGNVPAEQCPKPFMDDTRAIKYLAGLPTYTQILADNCLLYTSDAADERSSVGLGGRRITKKKKTTTITEYDI